VAITPNAGGRQYPTSKRHTQAPSKPPCNAWGRVRKFSGLKMPDPTGDEDHYAGKRHAAEYFFTRELPKVDAMIDVLAAQDNFYLSLDESAL